MLASRVKGQAMKADGSPEMKSLIPIKPQTEANESGGNCSVLVKLLAFQGFTDQANKKVGTLSYNTGVE